MKQNILKRYYKDKTIVIVGAAGGIGHELSLLCSRYTDKLVLIGRNVAKLQTLSNKISGSHFFLADITNATEVNNTLDTIEKDVGPVDISFNLAAVDYFIRFDHMTPDEITESCRINFEGTILYTQALLKKMMKRNSGTIVNAVSFSNGSVAFPFFAVDSATRAGLSNLFRSLRKELRKTHPGIRFTLFSPPPTKTETELSRGSSKVWGKLGVNMHEPNEVASNIFLKTAQGKDEIMGAAEKALRLVDTLSTKISQLIFFNKYQKISSQFLDKNKS
ncbi:MAG: SDR family oxidoreductase [Desulfobacula sp.]|uniref:SDR family NAD(P)-dependent oxidoreductase n=1 Tax=Desulfobacula sp. TaxID=2593537 RepID=UPI0025BA62F7|nr:SDR family NAD(P)-dependent oxidoreductase [Desulfobacula sp.]MCD4722689.1 SDR family oxidoreductase [Desulfobacula sp.]